MPNVTTSFSTRRVDTPSSGRWPPPRSTPARPRRPRGHQPVREGAARAQLGNADVQRAYPVSKSRCRIDAVPVALREFSRSGLDFT
jgi:hypothetical protein